MSFYSSPQQELYPELRICRCLNLAAELSSANPQNRVLVCVVDIRSGLQNQLPPVEEGQRHTKAALLSCALFRDAASSAIVGTE